MTPAWKPVLRRGALLAALLALAAGPGGCADAVRRAVYRPGGTVSDDPGPLRPGAQTVTVVNDAGQALKGLYWQGPHEAPVVVFFQGRTGGLEEAAAYAAPLLDRGYSLLVASYRGYAGNEGQPSETGLYADGGAFLSKAVELCTGCEVTLVGHSLGAAVALHWGGDPRVASVVTLGAFSTLAAAAPKLWRGWLKGEYANLDAAARLRTPVIFFRGRFDDTVSQEDAELLLSRAPANSLLLELDAQDHRPDMAKVADLIPAARRATGPAGLDALVAIAKRDNFAIFRK